LYGLPSLTTSNNLIGGLVHNRRQAIDRAVRAVFPSLSGAIGMLGRAFGGHK
jgi:hypothetical protein